MRGVVPNISLQPTVIPLRGLPAAELRRYAEATALVNFNGAGIAEVRYGRQPNSRRF